MSRRINPAGLRFLEIIGDGKAVTSNIMVIRRELAKLGLDWEDSQTKVETGKPRSEGKATSE